MTKTVVSHSRRLRGARIAMRALWKDMAIMARDLSWTPAPPRRTGAAGGVSAGWLRTHAIESAKHVDDS